MAERSSLFDARVLKCRTMAARFINEPQGEDEKWAQYALDGFAYDVLGLIKDAERFRAALEQIANQDYRGNRPPEQEIAWRALNA